MNVILKAIVIVAEILFIMFCIMCIPYTLLQFTLIVLTVFVTEMALSYLRDEYME